MKTPLTRIILLGLVPFHHHLPPLGLGQEGQFRKPPLRFGHETRERLGEESRVRACYQAARVAHDFRDRARRHREHRRATGHRLRQREAEPLVLGGADGDRRGGVEGVQLVVG